MIAPEGECVGKAPVVANEGRKANLMPREMGGRHEGIWENGDYLYLRQCEQEHRRRMNESSDAGKKLAWIVVNERNTGRW